MKKFFAVIGNPPYQEEAVGDNKTFTKPVYDRFLSESFKVSEKVEMVHPARFLFNAGGTKKSWNEEMLANPHFKVLSYEPNSENMFAGIDLKGGVAVTYYDSTRNYGPIGVFTAFPELNSIREKVWKQPISSLADIVSNRGQYRFSDLSYQERPDIVQRVTDKRISSPVFDKMPELFTEEKPNDGHEYIQIFGNAQRSRAYRWFRKDYLEENESLFKYKVMVPAANGSGALGEVLSTPLIGQPLIGHTETFLSIGSVDTSEEASAILKYIKTKFARVMLGILKITQHNDREKWRYVPLQDFTSSSDIDWSQSIPKLDQQLYAKYGLSPDEIEFIETHVKEMD